MDTADNTLRDTSPSTKQLTKRSTFTYGRARNEHRDIQGALPNAQMAIEQQEQSGGATADKIMTSVQQTPRRSPPISSDDDSDSPGVSSRFQFHFRRQMKELDEKFDKGDVHIFPSLRAKSLLPSPSLAEVAGPLPQDPMADATSIPCDTDRASEDPFSGSLSLPTSPSLHPTVDSFDISPLVTKRARGRTKRRVTSDSEQDPPSDSSSVSPVRHSINTPHLHSPPTPPTSEFEMSTVKKSGKAKGKAPVRDVQPLQFNSEDPSGSAISRSESKGKRRETSTLLKTKVHSFLYIFRVLFVDFHGDRHQLRKSVARLT